MVVNRKLTPSGAFEKLTQPTLDILQKKVPIKAVSDAFEGIFVKLGPDRGQKIVENAQKNLPTDTAYAVYKAYKKTFRS